MGYVITIIVLFIIIIGLLLCIHSLLGQLDVAEECYANLQQRHDETIKQLDLTRREKRILEEENAKLNEQLPKKEKTTRKTTTKKATTKRKSSK